MDLRQFRHFLFDLDGTLYDSRRMPIRLILGDLRHCLILKAERTVRQRLKGKAFPSEQAYYDTLFEGIARMRRITPEKARSWYFERYMPQMVAILKAHYKARPEVPALFDRIHARGGKVAVISDYGSVREKLDAIGIAAGMADYEFEAPAIGGLKPCADTFRHVLEVMQVQPEETLMVGDRPDTDGLGAAGAGIGFYLIENDTWNQLTTNILNNDSLQ